MFTASASDPDANLPLTHLWTFGAGSGIADSNAEDPGAVAFNATGTFQVTYTVTDNLGLADPTPDTRTIEVNPVQPPDGVIDAPANAVTQITVGESVNFTATASDPDGDLPLSHAWTFGAGSGVADSTAEDPGDIVFNIPGLFTVTYTVTDAKGVSDATPDTRVIAVSAATPAVRQLSFDLKAGELMQRAGAAEDAFRSGVAGFEPVMLTPAANTLRLEIGFTSDTALQTIFLAAFGTGSPRPETFASRLPGDCADGLNGCTHNFGPGMTLSNSTGALGDGSTSLVMTVTLTETNGVFAADFVNPYSEGPGACSDAPVDECSIGAHFPDLVDGDDIASFRGLVIDITFSTAVPVTVDGFEFNLLGGGIQIAETPLPEGWDLTVTEVMLSALELPANGNLVVTATVSNIGDQASPAQVRIRVFRSADAIINLSDIIIDDDTLENPILPDESFTQAANVKVPGAGGAGSWWIGVCIITAAGETDATNNCSDGTMILVVRPNGIFSDQFEN
jgi:PKD repeat protein